MTISTSSSITGQPLIAGSLEDGLNGTVRATNPANGEQLSPAFGLVDKDQLVRATEAAEQAFDAYRSTSPSTRAVFLECIATNIDAIGKELTERATQETGLPTARLEGERARTINQLRMFAEVARQGDHVRARIDPAQPDREPNPRVDIRQRHIPLGPVAVFGPSNFPLAFSTAGGDTAAALAAGCPVIVKAHNAHPGTAELVGHAIAKAVSESNLPHGVFSLVFGRGNEIGQALVADPRVKAVGFTGSQSGGTALMKTAAARPEPIPVYAEMSSINPVFVFPGAISGTQAESLAEGFVNSLLQESGQYCTNPGLVFVPQSDEGHAFAETAATTVSAREGQTMLTPGIARTCAQGVRDLTSVEGIEEVAAGEASSTENAPAPRLLTTDLDTFENTPRLQEEVFGAVGLIVRYSSAADLVRVANHLQGQLTTTIHATSHDFGHVETLLPVLERKAGRVLFNGWPTGVEVGHAMVHGGPFPATSDSRTTSVGSLAIDRFQRPVSYQNIPDELVPSPLKDKNPWQLNRRVNGELEILAPN